MKAAPTEPVAVAALVMEDKAPTVRLRVRGALVPPAPVAKSVTE